MLLLLLVVGLIAGVVGLKITSERSNFSPLEITSLVLTIVCTVFLIISLGVAATFKSLPAEFEARHAALVEAAQDPATILNAATRLSIVQFNSHLAVYNYWNRNIWTGVLLPELPPTVQAVSVRK